MTTNDEKISQLPDGGTITAGDYIPVVRSGANRKVNVNTAATRAIGDFLQSANNLSDLGDPAQARINLGITGGGSGIFLEMDSGTSYSLPAGTANVTLFINSADSGVKNITISASTGNSREILIKDWYGNSETVGQQIVIALASGVIDGLYSSIEISTNKGSVKLMDTPLGMGIIG